MRRPWTAPHTGSTSSRFHCGRSPLSPGPFGSSRPGARTGSGTPREVWTFVIWVVYAAYLHARATSGWSTSKAAYLALAGYGCILINYMVVNVYFVGMRSYWGM